MAKYFLTNKAVEDLTKIWNYTYDEWSEQQANKYYEILIASFKEIVQKPDIGKNYHKINSSLFGFKVAKHIVFYRKINSSDIEITRILHEMIDLKNRILE
jgi:toxin ParE1/3/4